VDYTKVALQTEYPDLARTDYEEVAGPGTPRSIRDNETVKYRDVTLQEAIQLALMYSKVMIDLGGTVIRAPDSLPTAYSPAVVETDPQFGVEGALSAFDAAFDTSLFCERNDRRYNNQMLGDAGLFMQDYDIFKAEISKRAVTGSQFTIRNITDFDNNNSLGNQFHHGAWDELIEAEVKHPLLRGGGVEFNRIAGPKGSPGSYNGVLIARIRTDRNLAEFQMGVRDLLSNVENAYWDLYFAYRDLDAKIRARDTALKTWRRVQALYRTGRRGGEAEKEAQAREQFFRFEEEVQNALVGRPLEQTQTNNGSRPGTFRGLPGVYVNERRLRLLIGLPPNEDYLLRPADEPPVAWVGFDWPTIATEAIVQREELRRQRWEIKRRELELDAREALLQLEGAQLDYQRNRELYQAKLVSPDVYDRMRIERDLKSNRVEKIRSQITTVDDNLRKTTICAPLRGTIYDRAIEVGEMVIGASSVSSGTEMMKIADLDLLEVRALVNEVDISSISTGMPVMISVESLQGHSFHGSVARIAPAASTDKQTQLPLGFEVTVLLDARNTQLKPGMTATVLFTRGMASNVVAVPLPAVFCDNYEVVPSEQQFYVYVKHTTNFIKRTVAIGMHDLKHVEITSGLTERVVVALERPLPVNPADASATEPPRARRAEH